VGKQGGNISKSRKRRGRNKKRFKKIRAGRAMTTKDWTNFPSSSLVLELPIFGWQRDSTTTAYI
jgi:hypothetical protein